MSHIITKFVTIDYSGLRLEKAREILYDLKEHIGKKEFKNLSAVQNNDALNIEGKVNINSILFNIKAEIRAQTDNYRIKYETNAPLFLTVMVISKIKSYLHNSLKSYLN